jgi:diacylglycerol O-acyltransferase
MERLSGVDAGLLYSDTGNATSTVTLVHIYDPSTAPGGRVRFKQILAHVEGRLHRSPVFRRRLLHVPLELDLPYWIEDERFDLEYHVRHIRLPEPGDWRQFCITASRIHARPLDLSRPLWEIHVIEGLDHLLGLPRGSFAMLAKVHHAAIAPGEGSELAALLHDTVPDPPPDGPPEPWFPESPPGTLSLLARGMLRNALSPLRMARPLASLATRLAPAALGLVADAILRPESMPVVRFNAVVSPHRVFETRRFPLAEVERIRTLVEGATLGDVILAVCGGGLRRYLAQSDELPAASLSAIAPVAAGSDRPGLELTRISLGTHLEDPVRRLEWVHAQAAAPDRSSRTVSAREIDAIARHAPAPTLALAAKLTGGAAISAGRRVPLAHCTIADVPGPTEPLFLGGARMTYYSAIMPIHDGTGLAFAVTRYDGMLIVSPTACREQVPDPERFAQCLRDSYQDYLALAPTAPRTASRPTGARRVRSGSKPASAAGTAAPAAPADRTAATPPRAARAGRRRSTTPAR